MTDGKRTAIVTGSAMGVGAATAKAMARRGWNVVINASKSLKQAEAVAKACESLGGKAVVCAGDVAKDADCRRIAETATKTWGRLDALVNNAGITKFVAMSDLDGISGQDFLDLYAVNVVGAFQMARACVPALRASGAGAIVNVSSNSALTGAGSSIAYVVTKGALNTLTLSLARTLAPEIRVNAVSPGFLPTDWAKRVLSEDAFQNIYRHHETTTPLKKVTTPEDVADAILWFVEGAGAVTGQFVTVDSGNHLHVNAPPRRPQPSRGA